MNTATKPKTNCFTEPNSFQSKELLRYSRQLILPAWSSKTQERIRATLVILPEHAEATALYLAAAGIGALHIQNLSRSLSRRINHLNPSVSIIADLEAEVPKSVAHQIDARSGDWGVNNSEFQYGTLTMDALLACEIIYSIVSKT